MAEIGELLQEMAQRIPGFLSCDVVGVDGISIGGISQQGFDGSAAAAYFGNVMQETKRALDAIGVGAESLDDVLFTTDKAYIFMRVINADFHLGVTTEALGGNLGMARMEMKRTATGLAQILSEL
jgi:predicted regulator of Ras-like GTPase activity (Roadblock/LC7/MglB family)